VMLPSWWRKKVGAGPSTELRAVVADRRAEAARDLKKL
jgi:hypothetical protein